MVDQVRLNNDVMMPQLGFGVFKTPPEETERAVTTAIETGYRSIDTATLYRNEREVGRAVRASGVPRNELFVTTKLWNNDQGYDKALKAFKRSKDELDIDYVDLYLIHWPVPSQDLYVDTWRALQKLLADGEVRAIGVSNFQPEHLRRLLAETDIVPVLNQVELHPLLQQNDVFAFGREHGIATEAWAPLAKAKVLDNPVLTGLADKHGKTPAQVVLRWHMQRGTIAIPKSVTPSRIRENFEVFDFELSDEDMSAMATLDAGGRSGPHPDTMGC